MAFINWIIERLNGISGFFYSIFLEVYGWVYPFWLAADFFYQLHVFFAGLAWNFMDFGAWVDDVAYKLTTFLSQLDLEAWFLQWKQKILDAWNWVYSAFWNVLSIVESWWLSTKTIVLGWIAVATEGLDTLKVAWDTFWRITFPNWTTELQRIGSELSNFFTTILPTLFDIKYAEEWWRGKTLDINKLVGDALKIWLPFYDSLSELWGKVAEFIADPLQWFYDRLDEIFERFW